MRAWPGPPADALHQHSGVKWIHADIWSTYQRTNFVTPAFPGYFSGHSTFSRAAAEVLTAMTGTPYFPGGLGTYSNYTLGFEYGPSQPMTLQWATYYDAADQAGISGLWGGIHPPIDNLAGRRAGSTCGKAVWDLIRRYFDGSVLETPLAIQKAGSDQYQVSYNTLRGVSYKLQSSANINQPFTDDSPATTNVFDAVTVTMTNSFAAPRRFHRAAATFAQ